MIANSVLDDFRVALPNPSGKSVIDGGLMIDLAPMKGCRVEHWKVHMENRREDLRHRTDGNRGACVESA